MSDDPNLQAALALAAHGVAVFPCDTSKRPRPGLRWKEEATNDARRIEAWWRRWPNSLPAFEPGRADHGLLAIDCDRHGGPDGVAAFYAAAPDEVNAPTVETPSGGRHIFFRNPNGLGNSRGALPAGVDVRGRGGYVIAEGATLPDGRSYAPKPGATGLIESLAADAVPDLPDWLAAILASGPQEREHPQRQIHSAPTPAAVTAIMPARAIGGREEAAFVRALADEASNVATAGQGQRNHALNTAAFNLGQMVAAGWGSAAAVEHELTAAALAAGLRQPEIRKTIASGLKGGMASPRPPLTDRAPATDLTPIATINGMTVDMSTGEVLDDGEDEGKEAVAPPIDEALTRIGGVLGEVVEFIFATSRRPNRRLALAAAITLCGTLLGRRMAGPTGLNTQLYTVVTYPTGGGKQHVIDAVSKLLASIKLTRHVGPPDFSSYQALMDHIKNEPCSICCIDEFGAFLGRIVSSKGSHENNIPNVLMQLWGKHYDAPYATQRTRQEASVAIYAPTLSILGFSTPGQFYAALKSRDISSGFLNRFLVIDGGDRVHEIDDPEMKLRDVPDSLRASLLSLYTCGHRRGSGNLDSDIPDKNMFPLADVEPVVVPWADDSARAFRMRLVREAETMIDQEEDGELYSRVPDIALRLATIRACSDQPSRPVLTVEHMRWAAAVAMQSARKLAADVKDNMEDQLSAAQLEKRFFRILQARGGRITMRDLRKAMSKHQRNIWDIDALIRTLENAGMIVIANRSGAGRPGKMVMDARMAERIAR